MTQRATRRGIISGVRRQKKPIFLMLLSIYLIIGGLLSPLFLLTSSDHQLADSLAARPEMNTWHFIAQDFGSAGIALVGFGLMLSAGIVGFGLWRLQGWARVVVSVIAGINGLWGACDFVRSLSHANQTLIDSIGWLIWVGINVFLIFYFQRSSIKILFAKDPLPV